MGSSTSRPTPWTDLPPDLILAVSARLQHPADIVRFHAVCRPWRDAAALLSPTAATTSGCLPWVLTSLDYRMVHSIIDFRHPFRSNDEIVLPEPPGLAQPSIASEKTRNRVASADGTAAWFLAARPDPKLIDIFTGAVTDLPPFPDEARTAMDGFRGIVYGDGTVFLYSFRSYKRRADFTAAIMRPGDTSWTVMEKRLDISVAQGDAMYHDGKVFVWAADSLWCFLLQTNNGDGVVGSELASSRWRWNADHDNDKYAHECSYVLESQGEILWASVLTKKKRSYYEYDDPHILWTLRVTVRALQKDPWRWVVKDARSLLGNRILFLGSPASFSAHQQPDNNNDLLGNTGSAYFAFKGSVFRYDFVEDDESELVKWLPVRPSHDDACAVWLRPRLTLAPLHEIQERIEAQKKVGSTSKLTRRMNHYLNNSIVVLSRTIRPRKPAF